MDTLFQDFPSSVYGFKFDHGGIPVPVYSDHSLVNGFKQSPSPDSPVESVSPSASQEGHPLDNVPFANEMLNYINEMLMEEDMEEKTCMLQDCLALQAAEKSFYEALGHQYPLPTDPLPPFTDQSCLVDSLERTSLFPDLQGETPIVTMSKGRKNYQRDGCDELEQGRSSKQSAISLEDSEQSEMFDQVLLCKGESEDSPRCSLKASSLQNGQLKGTTRRKKNGKKSEVVDLWSLLTQCAQAVAINDPRTAHEVLKQIGRNVSETGDGTQRLAHYFADALKTRLAGKGAPSYSPLVSNRTSAADILKAYGVYVLACPFKKMVNFYANKKIMEVAEKATTLHIVDFGICYGFQWPCLIQRLSARADGPPKLRITGVEFPQPGLRPAERVEETGRRLKRYCERFNVPFEYKVIAKKWETIQLEELKINKDEVVVVNSMYRLKNLPDDTLSLTSARDTVLKLIRSINPDLYIHGVANGTYNAPFFVTRFREALFHFSAQFDIFEANVSREDPQRMMYEREILGRDIMNVVACEGIERVERPETYKQWQARTLRAGFKPIPLDEVLVKKVKNMVQSNYHRDFIVDVDGRWMLQGWKGRVIIALSCWKPVRK
ncbi:hypothetical protein V6N13_094466 [Hibiscus sabdariffa]|uniref:Uncharacterized protein n=1 Tax=Hibiscus sabdariffa TaxID=183260 RepID=A0ABR2PPN1_9ROSI